MKTLRFLSAGESHGPALTVLLDGVPAGLPLLTTEHVDPWLRRRQGGYGRGRRQVIENDSARVLAGVRAGRTTGAPLSLQIENRDWRNWEAIMAPEPGGEALSGEEALLPAEAAAAGAASEPEPGSGSPEEAVFPEKEPGA